ncbi:MAG: hypothetical protein MUF51_00785 [Vicinamibacteria bacterium]|nr:hypothetical protein [Vicinamibacteria bacterium]
MNPLQRLLILALVVTLPLGLALFLAQHRPTARMSPTPVAPAVIPPSPPSRPPISLPPIPPFAGTLEIPLDLSATAADRSQATALDGLSREELCAYRSKRVAAHAQLGIYPADYQPLVGERQSIWSPITHNHKWLPQVPHYVANPYQLVTLVCANHVTPLGYMCPGNRLTYRARRMTDVVTGAAARCQLHRLYEPPYADNPGCLRLVTVNAEDAGLPWAAVDLTGSENIQPATEATRITRDPYRQHSLFHVGKYGVNNLSPEDRGAWLRLIDAERRTRVLVKLWRSAPKTSQDAADLTYAILIDPGGD